MFFDEGNEMSERKEEVYAFLHGKVGQILFDAPGANILTRTAFERLAEILPEFKRGGVETLIISGARGNFCGGLRLKYMQTLQNSPETLDETIDYVYEIADLISEFPLSIAIVDNGICGGVGAEIAARCKFIVAKKTQRPTMANAQGIFFAALSPRLAFMLGLGTAWRLSRKIGVANTARFLIKSDVTDLNEACRIGLVDALLSGDDFANEVLRFADLVLEGEVSERVFPHIVLHEARLTLEERELLSPDCSPSAISRILNAVEAIAGARNFEEALALDQAYFKAIFLSRNAQEAISAFLEKRTPDFMEDALVF